MTAILIGTPTTQKLKRMDPESVRLREWRRENFNRNPYAVTDPVQQEEARKKFTDNAKLATSFAKHYIRRYPSVPQDDIFQACRKGLMEACLIHVPELGKISTLAGWWVRKNIQSMLRDSGMLACRPQNWGTNIQDLLSTIETMKHEGLSPDFDDACDRMGIKHSSRGALRDLYFLNTTEVFPFHHVTAWKEQTRTIDEMIDREEFHELREALRKLPGMHVSILIDLFNGIPASRLTEKYQMHARTILRHRDRAIDWLKFHMGQVPIAPPWPLTVGTKQSEIEWASPGGTMVPPHQNQGED